MPTGPRRWTEREIRLLGTMNDYAVARRLRRTKHIVRNQRRALKIPPLKPHPKGRPWTGAELKFLSKIPDARVALRCKRTELSVASSDVPSKDFHFGSQFREENGFIPHSHKPLL